jgi:hypothetical protein
MGAKKNPGFITSSVSTASARNGPGTVHVSSLNLVESKAQDYALIKKALSAERFESHRAKAGEPDEIVFARYQWNAEICEKFYAPLRVLEVVMRNSFDAAIAVRVKDANWLMTVPPWLGEFERADVAAAHRFLRDRNRQLTQGRVVQEMSFGFWSSLLNSRYETLFHGIGAQVFPNLERKLRFRATASARFESIRNLRNRIFHFRRIWHRPNLEQDFNQLIEAIEWINADARRLLLPADAVAKFLDCLARKP